MRAIHKLALAAAGILALALILLWLVGPASDRTRRDSPKATSIGAHGSSVPALQRISSRTDAWARLDELPGPLALHGTVVDDHARPVAGALVTLGSQPARSAITAADGTWSFADLLPRPYKLEARKDDAFGRRGNIVPSDQPVVLRLGAGVEIRVRVVEAGSDTPIPDARVQIRGDERSATTTDAAGWARFRGMPPVEAFAIAAAKPGWSTTRAMISGGPVGREPPIFHVELAHAVVVSGRVVDHSGRAVAEAMVTAQRADAPTPIDAASDGVRTDARGEFTLTDVAPGNVVLHAYHPAFRSGPGTAVTAVAGTAPARITITMHHAVTVSGRVVDANGEPAAWAEVHAYVDKEPMWNDAGGRHLVADGAGEFRIDGLPMTSVRLVASTDSASSARARVVDLTGSRDVADVVLALELSGTIEGQVIDAQHRPVVGASVTCQPVGAKRVAVRCPGFAVSDASGAFRLGGLGEGSYKLVAMKASGAHPATEVIARTGDRAVQLVAPATGSITGRLRLSDGTLPAGAHIELQPGRDTNSAVGADGSFSIDELDPGAYTLLAIGEFVPVTKSGVIVTAGQSVALGEITIERGSSLDGTVVDEAGAPVAGARVIAGNKLGAVDLGETLAVHLDAASATTDDRGHFHLADMPASATTVIADHRTRGRSQPASPAQAPMKLVLHAGASLVGSVAGTDPKHRCFVSLDAASGLHYGAACDEHGNYRIARISEGDYLASVQGAAATTRSITVAAGQTARVDF